ncbi:MAG: hypothetical protein GY826_03745 [Fuerstiella sp.]|nr:hypothetical protein [Fuerstiella sp.]
MTRLLLAVIVLLAMTVLGLLWSLLLPIHDVHDTHDEMLTLLREVQRRTADENPYLGDAELRQVTQRLQDNVDTLQRSQLHWQRGNSALRLGRNIEAIEAFQNFGSR